MNWINDIKKYIPFNEQESKDKELFLNCINSMEEILTRNNMVAHITSSGYIVNKERDKVLMIYHNIYDSWAWTGGHADGDSDFLYVAIKEAKEETGIINVSPVSKNILSLDVLPVNGHIKKGNFISPHLHLNITYLLEADENDKLFVKEDENSGVAWIPIDKICEYSSEPYMITLYNKLNTKIKSF